jgi:DHA2 family multidrug resistance protein
MGKLSFSQIIVVLTVVTASLLQLIDSSIVNVALTQMMGNLGASFEDIGWVVTGYAVSNVIMITMSGWMSARFGRKYYFAFSIILFTVASILCGLSDNVWELVFFRVIQGIGGGGLLSTSQAILVETFPKEDLSMATAIYGVAVVMGPAAGPTLGGYITDNFNWQWIFYINIPFGIIATIMTLIYIKEPKDKAKAASMDWFAFINLVLAIGCLQIVLEKGQEEDWFATRYITVLTIVAVVSAVLFVWRVLTVKEPIVNLRLFKISSFGVGTLFNFIFGFGLYGTTFLVPIFCQGLLGLTAQQTGLVMLPGSLATAVAMPIVGFALKKRWVPSTIYAGIGMAMFGLFSYKMSVLNSGVDGGSFFWPLLIRGLGMGLIFIPLTTISLSDLEGSEIPQGTSLLNMMRQLGGSIGIAAITTFISVRSAAHYLHLSEDVTTYSSTTMDRVRMFSQGFMAKGFDAITATKTAYAMLFRLINQQATMLTYRDIFVLLGVFFMAIIPLLLIFKKDKIPTEGEDHMEMAME